MNKQTENENGIPTQPPKFDPAVHHRRSLRLKGYDYSQAGLYFITICVEGWHCLFGNIINEEMHLNDLGLAVEKEWLNTITIRKDEISLHEYVIMPNHFHAIVELHEGCENSCHVIQHSQPQLRSTSKTIGAVVRGFKGAVSKTVGRSIWQRNYYEHIIRNADSHQKIVDYIRANPSRWKKDRFYSAQI